MTIKAKRRGRAGGAAEVDVALNLATVKTARQSFARLIRGYASGTISENQSRCFSTLFTAFLPYLKLEADLCIEARLDAIEEKLNTQGGAL